MEVRLELDRTFGVYFPGETVRCTWRITIIEPMTLHHLYVRCKGEVNTEHVVTQKITIKGYRLIFKQYQTLLGSHLGIPNPSGLININQPDELHYRTQINIHNAYNVVIGAGTYTFKTNFELPYTIPPSFESNEGRIVYELKVQSQPDHEAYRFHFTVGPVVDLANIVELSNPLMNSDLKTFGFGCMPGKALTATVKMPAAGFAPGETTLVFVDVNNETNIRIVDVRIRLIEVLTYYMGKGERNINRERILCTHNLPLDNGSIRPGEQQEVFTELYFDPHFYFKFFTDINFLILAQYFIECEVVPTKYHSKLHFRTPIAIGTIPPENRLDTSDLIKISSDNEMNNNGQTIGVVY